MLRLGAQPHVGDEADRRPTQNKNKKESKNSSISAEACAFSPCCCQEMNKWLSMLGGQISHLPARFSQLIAFSPYKAGNEISLSAVSPRAPPIPPSSTPPSLPFYQDILCRGEEEGASSPSSKREVVWSNNAACTSGLIHAAIEQFQFTELLGGGWIFYHIFLSERSLRITSFICWGQAPVN